MNNQALIWLHSHSETQISSIGESVGLGFSLIGDYSTTKKAGYINSFREGNFGFYDSMSLSCLGTNNSLPSLLGNEDDVLLSTEIGITG